MELTISTIFWTAVVVVFITVVSENFRCRQVVFATASHLGFGSNLGLMQIQPNAINLAFKFEFFIRSSLDQCVLSNLIKNAGSAI